MKLPKHGRNLTGASTSTFRTDIESDTVPPVDERLFASFLRRRRARIHLNGAQSLRHWAKLENPRPSRSGDGTLSAIDYPGDPLLLGAEIEDGRTKSLEEIDPNCSRCTRSWYPSQRTESLAGVAVDAVFDMRLGRNDVQEAFRIGIIFCSFSEAVQNHPELVQKFWAPWCPTTDNFFASLNSRCLATARFATSQKEYAVLWDCHLFSINAAETGQFERTLIRRREGATVAISKVAPRDARQNQLHAAVVELVAHRDAQIKYSRCKTGIPATRGKGAFIISSQSAANVLANGRRFLDAGRNRLGYHLEVSELYLASDDSSVSLCRRCTNKLPASRYRHEMIHMGKNTKSTYLQGFGRHGKHVPRGPALKIIKARAEAAATIRQCDSVITGRRQCRVPILSLISNAHNASQASMKRRPRRSARSIVLYCRRNEGISNEDARHMIVTRFLQTRYSKNYDAFAVEARYSPA